MIQQTDLMSKAYKWQQLEGVGKELKVLADKYKNHQNHIFRRKAACNVGGSTRHLVLQSALIKNKIKFSSYMFKEILSGAVAKSL
jgi:hypothetical protein